MGSNKIKLNEYLATQSSFYLIYDLSIFYISHRRFGLNNAFRTNRKRAYVAGCKEHLSSIEDKLIFILHSYKSYPTMDILATH